MSDKPRVLVTGGAGFLGRVVVPKLQYMGYDTAVPRSECCNLRRQDHVYRLFEDIRPRIVVHLAATVGGIGANRAKPGTFFYDNMIMGVHIIEACRVYEVENLVMVGTACSYPKFPLSWPHWPYAVVGDQPTRQEASLFDGYPEETNAPYGIAKRALLVQMLAYHQQYGLKGTFLIPTNLYGPGDNFDPETSHVIPAMIRKIQAAIDYPIRSAPLPDKVTLWGTGNPTRDFLYVDDAADAITRAVWRPRDPEPINLSTGRSISMKHLALKVRDIMNYKGDFEWDTTMPDGQPYRVLDPSRAAQVFDWLASTDLDVGLKNTVGWYRTERVTPPHTAPQSSRGLCRQP